MKMRSKTQLDLDSPEKRFHREVEKLVEGGADYIDAVIHWCERNGFEVEFAASMIKSNSTSKTKMLESAEKLNFIIDRKGKKT